MVQYCFSRHYQHHFVGMALVVARGENGVVKVEEGGEKVNVRTQEQLRKGGCGNRKS